MKRSKINEIIKEAVRFFDSMNFRLPPFGSYSAKDWKNNKNDAKEIFDLGLGWDVTDFGLGNFYKTGLLLFTIRNGKLKSSQYTKPYAEKIMIVREGQITPMHFHWYKMEDIINRGGGNLIIELYNSDKKEKLSDNEVVVAVDGHKKVLKAGSKVALKPGESICLTPGLYHRFYGEEKKGTVLVGEVSMVNDDAKDNRFFDSIGRFSEIEEDELPVHLLCNDYKKFVF